MHPFYVLEKVLYHMAQEYDEIEKMIKILIG